MSYLSTQHEFYISPWLLGWSSLQPPIIYFYFMIVPNFCVLFTPKEVAERPWLTKRMTQMAIHCYFLSFSLYGKKLVYWEDNKGTKGGKRYQEKTCFFYRLWIVPMVILCWFFLSHESYWLNPVFSERVWGKSFIIYHQFITSRLPGIYLIINNLCIINSFPPPWI